MVKLKKITTTLKLINVPAKINYFRFDHFSRKKHKYLKTWRSENLTIDLARTRTKAAGPAHRCGHGAEPPIHYRYFPLSRPLRYRYTSLRRRKVKKFHWEKFKSCPRLSHLCVCVFLFPSPTYARDRRPGPVQSPASALVQIFDIVGSVSLSIWRAYAIRRSPWPKSCAPCIIYFGVFSGHELCISDRRVRVY